MKITAFNKYQGTGNDFIIIDNRSNNFNPENQALIKRLCDRKFGIGADGLILINESSSEDFEMIYFNSDGFVGSMCGNGGRCAAAFAIKNGIAGKNLSFRASDGIHVASEEKGLIRLKINDINTIDIVNGNYFLNTGSPHYIIFTKDLDNYNVYGEGRKIRYSSDFAPAGTNVNYVEQKPDSIYVRTYERGVEDETLSCGTGVTASAIAAVLTGHFGRSPVNVETRGGKLIVEFTIEGKRITDIWLNGPATFVFDGKTEI